MSAVLNPQSPATTVPPSSLSAVPRAMWVVLGTLALATAGLAGALVMRSVDQNEPASVALAAQAAPMQVAAAQQTAPAQPAPVQLQAAPQAPAQVSQPAPAPAAKPAPVRVAKPAPARPVVQQASGSAVQTQAPVEPAPQVVAQAPSPSRTVTPIETTRAAICTTCGTVQAVQEVKEKGQGTGIGAVGGAVIGGLLGNQVGGGNGKKAMTVIGAVGGGLAGHEAEKHVRASTAYDVQVRMEDGSVRTIRRSEPVAPGTRVFVEGNQLRVGGSGMGSVQPGTLRTSAPVGTGT